MPVVSQSSGIYRIRCHSNGRSYVGSAKNLRGRKNAHWSALARGKHHSRHLQMCWNKYGADNFEFEVIRLVDDPAQLLAAEQIELDKETDPLNWKRVAKSRFGTPHSAETRRKIGDAGRGRVYGPDRGRKISAALSGRKHAPEHTKKVADAQRGKPKWAPEERERVAERLKRQGHARIGIRLPPDWCKHIGDGHRGKKMPETAVFARSAGMAKVSATHLLLASTLRDAGLGIGEISEIIGVHSSTMSRILAGKRLAYGGTSASS